MPKFSTYLAIAIMVHFGHFSPIINYDKAVRYEEYVIEHEISATQAKNSALTIDLASVPILPGCQNCTRDELVYCAGADLINDHCCCDKRFSESLPFIPHTCYSGTTLCRTIAEDCEEYYRRKACCCDRYVLRLWKQRSLGNRGSIHETNSILLCICFLMYFFQSIIQRFSFVCCYV